MNKKRFTIVIVVTFFAILIINTIQATSPPIENNTIAYFHLDEHFHKDDNIQIQDSSGNQNNGVVIGAGRIVPGLINSAHEFDGVNDQINIGSNSENKLNWKIDGNFTWSMWINVKDNSQNVYYGLFEIIDDQARSLVIGLNQTRNLFVGTLDNSLSEDSVFGTTSLVPGTWYHTVITYTNQNINIYLNSSLENSGTISEFRTSIGDQNKIGNEELFDANSCNCTIDEVIVYNRTLNTSEIEKIYSDYISIAHLKSDQTIDIYDKNLTTTGTGFFGWLGTLASKITKIFVQEVYADNVCLNQNCSANISYSNDDIIIHNKGGSKLVLKGP